MNHYTIMIKQSKDDCLIFEKHFGKVFTYRL